MRKKLKNKGVVNTIIITMIIAIIITSFLSIIGLESQQTIIGANGTLETYLITTQNILSIDGIKYLFSSAINNFILFKPLAYLIISLISISILEKSGLLNLLTNKLRRLKFRYLTILVMIVCLLFNFLGDFTFVYLMPIVATIYKKIGKNPLLGIITVFISLTIGYSIGFVFNYNDYFLGTMTEASARVDVDKNYLFTLSSNLYIKLFSSIILILISSHLIENKLALKFNNPEVIEEEYNFSKKAGQYTFITFMICILVISLLIIPGVPYLGLLLDNNEVNYIAKLFGENAAFGQGLLYIITIVVMICSYVYGKISKNINNVSEFNDGLTIQFENTGHVFVYMFFISQLIGIINYTNIGNVISNILLNFMSSVEFSGIPLIFVSFILIVLMTLLIPNIIDKWIILSPVIVPLFMRSNITPNFTQFIFGVADGVDKSLTPIFPYYIIMLGLMEKYKNDEEVSFYGILKKITPTILIISGVMLLLLIGWFLIGLPLGINSFPSL